jgi:hypothetical protein
MFLFGIGTGPQWPGEGLEEEGCSRATDGTKDY